MSGSATVNVKVFGYDMDVTNAVANDLKEKMRRLEGVRDVKLSRDDLRPEYNVVFDRDRHDVGDYVRVRITGCTPATLFGEEII